MNELIKIETNENMEPIVSGRDLHEALGVETQYTKWFERMCEYGFTENSDYCTVSQKRLTAQGNETTFTNHAIKLDMAKEIAMLQRNEAGKKMRQYFIQVEKDFNSPEKIMARALKIAEDKIRVLTVDMSELQNKIEEQQPKVLFANAVETSHTSILVGDMAKLLRQNGIDIGQNRLFEWLRNNNYLIKRGERRNSPTQTSMDAGLFEIKERTISDANGVTKITKTTKVTGKGQTHLINKFLNKKEEGED